MMKQLLFLILPFRDILHVIFDQYNMFTPLVKLHNIYKFDFKWGQPPQNGIFTPQLHGYLHQNNFQEAF